MTALPSASSGERALPACVVKVRGASIGPLHALLSEVSIDVSREVGADASLVFEIQRDERGRFSVLDLRLFTPFTPISIATSVAGRPEEVMRGYVLSVNAAYPETMGASTFTVTCRDEMIALDREHVRKAWGQDAPTSDAVILSEIARKHRLQVDPKSGRGLSGLFLIQDATDAGFLLDRARANSYELRIRKGVIYFGPHQLSSTVQPTIKVHAGLDTTCRSLSIAFDGHAPTQVAFDLASLDGPGVRRRVVSSKLRSLGRTSADPTGAGLREYTWRLSRAGSFDEDELTTLARKRADDFSMRLRASGELDGVRYGQPLEVGAQVGVDGVGDWLAGLYYVDRVRHTFRYEGYTQSFELIRNAYDENLSAGQGGALRGIR